MTRDELEENETYACKAHIDACAWDNDQCAMGDQLDVQEGDKLTFIEEVGDDNLIFYRDGTLICLHSNDLTNLTA